MSANIAIQLPKVKNLQENNSNGVTGQEVSSIYDYYIDDSKTMLFVHPMGMQGGIERHLPVVDFQLDEVMGFAMERGYIEDYNCEEMTVELVIGGSVYTTSFDEFFTTFFTFSDVLEFMKDDIQLTKEMKVEKPYRIEILNGNVNGLVVTSKKRYATWSNVLRSDLHNLDFVKNTRSNSAKSMIIYTGRKVTGEMLKSVSIIFGV